MKPPLFLVFCLATLFPVRAAWADAPDSDIRVDVVVDLTAAGKKVPKPSPEHPAYFYPVTRGYTEGGQPLADEKSPPPTAEVQHLIAKALAAQGYLLATNASPPSLVLIFWWGCQAPDNIDPMNSTALSGQPGKLVGRTVDFMALSESGALPTNSVTNHNEMEQLVFGSNYEPEPLQNLRNLRFDALMNASREARYYIMVSALDFKAAEQKRVVTLWTARISTSRFAHTLEEVLPALIARGAPEFGRDTNGPHLTSEPLVPLGHVVIGNPVLKSAAPVSPVQR